MDDQLPDLGGAGERHLVDVVVGGQGGTGSLAEPGHNVDHPVGHPGLGDELGQAQRRERGLLSGLEDHAVSRSQSRPELPRRHQKREVPRDDLAHDSHRLAQGVRMEVGARRVRNRDVDCVALDLGRPPGHIVEQVGGQGNVGHTGHPQGLAVVQCLELGQFVEMVEDQVTNPPDDPAPLRGRQASPGTVLEGPAGCPHRPIDVLDPAGGDGRQRVTGGRIGRLEGLARSGVNPSSVNEQLPGGGDEIVDPLVQRKTHDSPSPP